MTGFVTCHANHEAELGRWRLSAGPASDAARRGWLAVTLTDDVTLLAEPYGTGLELLVDDEGRRDHLSEEAATIVERFASRQPADIARSAPPVRSPELWRRLALALDAMREATGEEQNWSAAEAQATRRRLGLDDDRELTGAIAQLAPHQRLDRRVVATAEDVARRLDLGLDIEPAPVPEPAPETAAHAVLDPVIARAGTPNELVWLHRAFVSTCPVDLTGPCEVRRDGDRLQVTAPLLTNRYATDVRDVCLGAFPLDAGEPVALAPLTVGSWDGRPVAVANLTVGTSRRTDELELVLLDSARPTPSTSRRELEALRFAERHLARALRRGDTASARRWASLTLAGMPEGFLLDDARLDATVLDDPLIADGLGPRRR